MSTPAPTPNAAQEPLSADYIRKIAALSRLAITDAQVEEYRTKLTGVLGYVQRLSELDLTDVEPLANVGGTTNRLDEDTPHTMLPTAALMKMAPSRAPENVGEFVRIPKVLGEGGVEGGGA